MYTLKKYVCNTGKYKKYTNLLKKNMGYIEIRESSSDSKFTSYTVNKGEELVVCIRSRNRKNELHDINTLMYVVIHEMAHMACPEIGHTKLFYEINKYLLNCAIKINLYQHVNYSSSPIEYCGIMLNDNILS